MSAVATQLQRAQTAHVSIILFEHRAEHPTGNMRKIVRDGTSTIDASPGDTAHCVSE